MKKADLIKKLIDLDDDVSVEIGVFDEYGDIVDNTESREIKNGYFDMVQNKYIIG